MVPRERRVRLRALALIACVQTACGLDLRAIVVADADAPDVPTASDVQGLDATPDAPASPDVADAGAPEAPDVPPTPDVPADAVACSAPRSPCGTACVMLATDDANCGACANRCAADETCTAGTCLARLPHPSPAGTPCTHPGTMAGADSACGATMVCFATESTPECSIDCVDNASQAVERGMCGGAGSTCLRYGDGAMTDANCERACAPGAAPSAAGACRAGYVCTGFWFTHGDGRADTPGCAAFCSRDSDCGGGERCNARVGRCGVRGVDPTRLPDGAPCDPTVIELVPEEGVRRNTQCRGECWAASQTAQTHGICGSSVDLAVTPTCPDDPATMPPETDLGADNYGLCINRRCAANRDCSAPLVCRYWEDAAGRPDRMGPSSCDYATAAQPSGIP